MRRCDVARSTTIHLDAFKSRAPKIDSFADRFSTQNRKMFLDSLLIMQNMLHSSLDEACGEAYAIDISAQLQKAFFARKKH